MSSKIIFWINDDLSGLGLPKILQEKYNFDVYAILDVADKHKKFFQEQKLIKFSKIWYFHDYISKTAEKPDTEYLKLIEKKYKVDLGLLASNDRFFNKFNEFYKFSPDEILLILEQECKLFEKILDEVKPDFLIMGITTLHHNHLFYKICQARGVKILMFRESYLRDRWIIASNDYSIDHTEYDVKHNFGSLSEIQNYVKKYDATAELVSYKKTFQNSKIKYLQSALKYLFSDNSNLKTHFTYYGRTKFAVLRITLINVIKKKYRQYFINKNLIRDIENKKPFIYFPLHIEPERSTLIAAPLFTNQIEVVTNIAKSLPSGYNLYVKEHPLMYFREWRSISYYKQIMSLPNVTLIHPSVKSQDIIKKSSLVISIFGTSSLEAGFYNRPSITFGKQEFSYLPSVHQIKIFHELPDAIKTSLKKKVDVSDLNNYLNLIESNSFEMPLLDLSSDFDHIFHFAAQSSVPLSLINYYKSSSNNLESSLKVFEYSKKFSAFVNFTSTLLPINFHNPHSSFISSYANVVTNNNNMCIVHCLCHS